MSESHNGDASRIPIEITAALLAAGTVVLTLQPLNLPTWASFVTWGGTVLLGETTLLGSVKKMWPPLLLGTSFGVLATLLFAWSASASGGDIVVGFVLNVIIIFFIAVVLLSLSHFPIFSVAPAMFFAFAAFSAIVAGNGGPSPHTLFTLWLSATGMTFLGPILAWASMKLMLPLPSRTRAHRSSSTFSIQLDGTKMNKNTLRHLHQQAAHHRLGEPLVCIAEPQKPISRLGILAIFVGLVLIVVLALLAPVLIALLPLWQIVLVLIVAVCWIATGSWLQLGSWMRRKGIEALLCTDGMVWRYRRSVESVRWQDIESLWRKTTRDSAMQYEIWLRDGRVVVLDSRVLGSEKLARFVEGVVTSRHLSSLMQAYDRGQMLKFGLLCVSQHGLQLAQPQKVLHWSEIKYIDCIQNVLIIRSKQQDDWATISLSTLPNACVLEAVIRHLHRAHRVTAASERSFLPTRRLKITSF